MPPIWQSGNPSMSHLCQILDFRFSAVAEMRCKFPARRLQWIMFIFSWANIKQSRYNNPQYFLPFGINWKLTTPRGEDLTPKIASSDLLVVAHITFRGVVCQPISQSQKATELWLRCANTTPGQKEKRAKNFGQRFSVRWQNGDVW